MDKLTDNEIITAWKCCSNVITSSCKECPLHLTYNANCVRELMRVSLDLYNRQKAEIFNLKEEVKHFQLKNSEFFKLNNSLMEENDYRKSENERLQYSAKHYGKQVGNLIYHLEQAKSEAYREFAKYLTKHIKDELEQCGNPNHDTQPIAYGTVLGLKSALSFVKTASIILESDVPDQTATSASLIDGHIEK